MPEYIERGKIKFHRTGFTERCHNDVWTEYVDIAYKSQIDSIPAADVRPVVRGKWKPVIAHFSHGRNEHAWEEAYAPEYTCSECGFELIAYGEKNFCPNCGATMETRARWIPNAPPRDLRPRCSACNILNPTEESTCPNCGAKMEES